MADEAASAGPAPRADLAVRGTKRRLSVRLRATLAAVATFGLILIVAALAALVAQRAALRSQVAEAAALRAESIAHALDEGIDPIIFVRVSDAEIVQIVTKAGTVVASSANLAGAPEIHSATWPTIVSLHEADTERYLTQRASVADGDLSGASVVVGRSLDSVTAALAALGGIFAIGVPFLVALAGVITWVLVGGALRPVDRMRRQVDAISETHLDVRVPAPGGRDEVAALAVTMNGMLDRLQRAADAQRRFVSDASHELRSPLAALHQSAELARDYPATITKAELAETSLAESERMAGLVDGMLWLARRDEKHLAVDRAPIDLADIARAAIPDRPRVPVDTEGLEPLPSRGDEALLTRLVRNLIDNAIRHASAHVWLTGRRVGTRVELRVADDGAGIPAEQRERVFERFTRLDEARARGEGGAGLGLAIVREIAAAHGGTVVAGESEHGGAQFTLAIPASSELHEDGATA